MNMQHNSLEFQLIATPSEQELLPDDRDLLDKYSDIDTADNLAEITLYDNGIIKSCSNAGAELLGCSMNVLLMHHVSKILPQLAGVSLLEGNRVNSYLRFLSRAGHQFEVIGFSGSHFLSAVFFNDIEDFGSHCMRIIFRPISVLQ